jgi:hypothetical protein
MPLHGVVICGDVCMRVHICIGMWSVCVRACVRMSLFQFVRVQACGINDRVYLAGI